MPELRRAPHASAPLWIVGTRKPGEFVTVSTSSAEDLARRVGAAGFVECLVAEPESEDSPSG